MKKSLIQKLMDESSVNPNVKKACFMLIQPNINSIYMNEIQIHTLWRKVIRNTEFEF